MKKFIPFALFFSLCGLGSAGTITLTSTLSCEVSPPEVKAKMVLENKGDEAAHNVRIQFSALDRSWASEMFSKIDVGQSVETEQAIELEPPQKGVYPLAAKIFFQDGAGYPMSTVVVTPFTYLEAATPSLFGRLEDLRLTDKGELLFHITNNGYDDLAVTVQVLVPDELSLSPGQKQLELKSRSRTTVPFELENFSALAGAAYPVWAVVEYEQRGVHFSYIRSALITLEAPSSIFTKYWWLWTGLAGIILIAFLWLNLKGRTKMRT